MPEKQTKRFFCPRCHESLSVLEGSMVKLAGTLTAETFSVTAEFFLPAELGRYGAIVAGPVKVREGARVEFACPRCAADLTAPHNHDLVEIHMTDESGRDYEVLFSKVYGQHVTFVVDLRAKALVSRHGEHAPVFERTVNFFGA